MMHARTITAAVIIAQGGAYGGWSFYVHEGNQFTGTISWVRLDAGDDDHSHHQEPEKLMANAMLKQ